MQHQWRRDLDAAPLGKMVYLTVASEDAPEFVPVEDVVGVRLEAGWFVLDANCERIPCGSVSAWAKIERTPHSGDGLAHLCESAD